MAYELLRRSRARRQLREFDALLDKFAAQFAADARVTARLPDRRDTGGGPLGVVAFGTREWEDNGLWQSFRRQGPFSLWEYRAPFVTPPNRDSAYRASLADKFLRHIERVENEQPVHCAFFYASAEHIDLDLFSQLHERGISTVVMSLDDKHQFLHPTYRGEPMQLRLACACDVYWTTWRTGAEYLRTMGANAWYAPAAAHPDFYRPVVTKRDLDVVFVGQAYGTRAGLVRYLRRRGIDVTAYGAGWPNGFLTFDQVIEAVGRAHVVLGVGGVGFMDEVKHLKGRDFEIPMCGALYLTSYNPELCDHFEIGSEILCYSSPQECADTLHWILRNPADAQRIREGARTRCLRDHTWEHRLESLFNVVKGVAANA